LFASLIGTTIEFFDFYIYANAAVLVFPKLFFPKEAPATARLASLLTFAIAFIARPVGSAIFGHFGDRIGRKATLVAALLTMGVSTVCIGILPTYATIGVAAPILLAVCRFGQGLGLGGEWGGAVLLAIENAPAGKRAWYGMFPQLGAPIGFMLSGGIFLILSRSLTDDRFFAYGWRIPFLASAALVLIGLYVRLTISETPVFREAVSREQRVKIPMIDVIIKYWKPLVIGTISSIATFVLFYLMTVFALSWGTTALGYSRNTFLELQLLSIIFFALTIPISAAIAERGRRRTLLVVTLAIAAFGIALAPMFSAGIRGAFAMLVVGFSLMGLTYGPLGTVLSELFPTNVRYTGTSLAFNLAGILGASLAPSIAVSLAKNYSLHYVGYYLCFASVITAIGLLFARETKDSSL
jgi:metabolite-proton symporter